MTTLLLIRHGESEANRQKLFAGHLDFALADKGFEQAKVTAEYIGKNYDVSAVYASDLKRAFDTGKCIADHLGLAPIPDKNLREIHGGKFEGHNLEYLMEHFEKEYTLWKTDVGNSQCPGGESPKILAERVLSALTSIAQANPDKTVVVATHATPIRIVRCIFSGHTIEDLKDFPNVSNSSITEISYHDGEWSLIKDGFDEFLSDMKTSFTL